MIYLRILPEVSIFSPEEQKKPFAMKYYFSMQLPLALDVYSCIGMCEFAPIKKSLLEGRFGYLKSRIINYKGY